MRAAGPYGFAERGRGSEAGGLVSHSLAGATAPASPTKRRPGAPGPRPPTAPRSPAEEEKEEGRGERTRKEGKSGSHLPSRPGPCGAAPPGRGAAPRPARQPPSCRREGRGSRGSRAPPPPPAAPSSRCRNRCGSAVSPAGPRRARGGARGGAGEGAGRGRAPRGALRLLTRVSRAGRVAGTTGHLPRARARTPSRVAPARRPASWLRGRKQVPF